MTSSQPIHSRFVLAADTGRLILAPQRGRKIIAQGKRSAALGRIVPQFSLPPSIRWGEGQGEGFSASPSSSLLHISSLILGL